MTESVQLAPRGDLPRREEMQTPEEVVAMLRLQALGWGIRRIAKELGCSPMTVRRYVSEGGWVSYRGRGRLRRLAGLEEWVAERFRRHGGNADLWTSGTTRSNPNYIVNQGVQFLMSQRVQFRMSLDTPGSSKPKASAGKQSRG
jgi:hypothetical protein